MLGLWAPTAMGEQDLSLAPPVTLLPPQASDLKDVTAVPLACGGSQLQAVAEPTRPKTRRAQGPCASAVLIHG